MLIELGLLAGGMVPGRLLRRNARVVKTVGTATQLAIYALLFALGARLGGDDALFAALPRLGASGALLGFCCTMGSALCVLPAQRFFKNDQQGRADGGFGSLLRGLKGSFIILGCFCAGLVLGRLGFLPAWLCGDGFSLYLLWFMLLCVGMGMGFELTALLSVRALGLRILLIPLLTIAGTALGALAAVLFLPGETVRSALAVGAGFGYYSLSSVIITELGNPALGSVALLANIFRELFTLLSAPLLVRLLGPLAPVAAGGAASMDTCLPVIARFSGERFVFIAVFSAFLLTMLVPFLVPMIVPLAPGH